MTDITREAVESAALALELVAKLSEPAAQLRALRTELDEAERERLAINLLMQTIHNGIYEYGVPDAHPLHQLVHEAIGSSSVGDAADILGAATTTHIADLNQQVTILRDRCDAAIARAEAAERVLAAIHDRAHDYSTGPEVPDAFWEIRGMAGAALAKEGGNHG